MKKLLLASLAVAAFAVTEANAGNTCVKVHPYVSAKAGYAWANAKAHVSDVRIAGTDQVLVGALAAGVKVCAFRTEVEYNRWGVSKDESYATGTRTQSSLFQQSLMFNGYFDIPTKTAFRPYVGAGMGIARVRGKVHWGATGSRSARRENEFAWQVGGGFGYNMTKNLTLDVGYRFVNNGTVKMHNSVPGDVAAANGGQLVKYRPRNQEILVGLRYTF